MYSNFPRIVGAAACGVAQRVADRRLGQRSLQQRRRGEAAVGGAQLTSLKVKMDLFFFCGGNVSFSFLHLFFLFFGFESCNCR